MSSTYEIKMLYDAIAHLTKENIKLKQENEMLEGLCNEWSGSNHIYEQEQQKLEKEIKELKEEIDKFTYTPTTKKI
jgi:cell division protein FtsB